MPVRKPVITELETKRVMKPSLSRPKTSWNSPTRMASTTNACTWRSAGSVPTAFAAPSAPALVLSTFMTAEAVNTAATGVPITVEYTP